MVLEPRDNAALVRFIAEVTDKGSPSFGRYLPAGAFASRFGPTPATLDAVKSALQGDGLRVTGVSGDGLLVGFTGPAGRVESAFHTGLESYRLADKTIGRAATSAVSLPSTVAGSVAAVVGLSDLVRERPAGLVRAPASARGSFPAAKMGQFVHPPGSPTPCADATAAAESKGGLTDDQIANAYGAFGLYDVGDLGAGQRIAVPELEPFKLGYIRTFDTCYFGAAQAASMIKRLSVTRVDGPPKLPGEASEGEVILDLETISALAPGASIDVYETPPETIVALVDDYATIIDDDRDQVLSTSIGECEQELQLREPGAQQAENFLFEQAAAQGQSVFAAAGDTGSDDCNEYRVPEVPPGQNPLSVDDPGSQPYVVSVGGTTIDDAASQPPLEQVWNDGPEGGAGGGISMSWAMPSWQLDAKVPGIVLPGSADYTNAGSVEQSFGYPQNFCQAFLPGASASTPCRTVPDVSAQADLRTGAITVYNPSEYGSKFPTKLPDGWDTSGGTSGAAPIWAALLAVANASPTCAGQPATARGVGFASPLLYAVASNPAQYAASFNDITTGNNDIYGLDDGLVFPATSGYDLASGLGSPRLTGPGGTAGLAYYLCSLAGNATRPVVSGLSPTSGTTTGGESIVISGGGFQSGGVADVAGVQVGSWQVPLGAFQVTSPSSITATLPPAKDTLPPGSPAPLDGAGPVEVIVTLTDGASSAPSPESTFQYLDMSGGGPIPSVTGVSPSGGSERSPKQVSILGSGFTAATKVSFGGVSAPAFKVDSPFRITVTPPRYSPQTACSPLPGSGVYAGENAANDICQVQVTVTNANGTSATGQILPPLEGPVAYNSESAVVIPPGCGCEEAPAPSEFDYAPAPTISSISTSAGPAQLASEESETLITVHGTGLNLLTMDGADFGNPHKWSSIDAYYAFLTGTEMQIEAPEEELTVGPLTVPFSVRTEAGQAPASSVTYAGVPSVSAVVNTLNPTRLDGLSGAPDTGGTPIQVSGQGLEGQILRVQFLDSGAGISEGTQYTFTPTSDTSLSTQTVEQNPALADVLLCTVTGCSTKTAADRFYLYPPGEPAVDSLTPSSGKSTGKTKVLIHGENLGCPLAVFFGNVEAAFTPVHSGLDCGSTSVLEATSPPGSAGSEVPVSVSTVESYFTGTGPSSTTANFTYTKG